jgi:hypothetical protein
MEHTTWKCEPRKSLAKARGLTMRLLAPKLVGFLAFAFILSLLVSCSSKPEDAIVGKWSEIGGTEKIELFKDGTITVVNKDIIMGGKYTFVDKDRIRIELSGLGALLGPFVVTVSISGDELTLTMPDGKVTKYRREK